MLSRIVWISALTILLAGSGPSIAHAQGFSFAFGSPGHGCHGHHGGWYGFNYYRPPPYYYYPPPPVTYVYPAAPVVSVVQPAPYAVAAPAPPAPAAFSAAQAPLPINAAPGAARGKVLLRNPVENGADVAFLVEGHTRAELHPDGLRIWNDRTTLSVEFDRGGDFGVSRKLLRPGEYQFVITDGGWDIVAAAAAAPGGLDRPAQVQRNTLPARR